MNRRCSVHKWKIERGGETINKGNLRANTRFLSFKLFTFVNENDLDCLLLLLLLLLLLCETTIREKEKLNVFKQKKTIFKESPSQERHARLTEMQYANENC